MSATLSNPTYTNAKMLGNDITFQNYDAYSELTNLHIAYFNNGTQAFFTLDNDKKFFLYSQNHDVSQISYCEDISHILNENFLIDNTIQNFFEKRNYTISDKTGKYQFRLSFYSDSFVSEYIKNLSTSNLEINHSEFKLYIQKFSDKGNHHAYLCAFDNISLAKKAGLFSQNLCEPHLLEEKKSYIAKHKVPEASLLMNVSVIYSGRRTSYDPLLTFKDNKIHLVYPKKPYSGQLFLLPGHNIYVFLDESFSFFKYQTHNLCQEIMLPKHPSEVPKSKNNPNHDISTLNINAIKESIISNQQYVLNTIEKFGQLFLIFDNFSQTNLFIREINGRRLLYKMPAHYSPLPMFYTGEILIPAPFNFNLLGEIIETDESLTLEIFVNRLSTYDVSLNEWSPMPNIKKKLDLIVSSLTTIIANEQSKNNENLNEVIDWFKKYFSNFNKNILQFLVQDIQSLEDIEVFSLPQSFKKADLCSLS